MLRGTLHPGKHDPPDGIVGTHVRSRNWLRGCRSPSASIRKPSCLTLPAGSGTFLLYALQRKLSAYPFGKRAAATKLMMMRLAAAKDSFLLACPFPALFTICCSCRLRLRTSESSFDKVAASSCPPRPLLLSWLVLPAYSAFLLRPSRLSPQIANGNVKNLFSNLKS